MGNVCIWLLMVLRVVSNRKVNGMGGYLFIYLCVMWVISLNLYSFFLRSFFFLFCFIFPYVFLWLYGSQTLMLFIYETLGIGRGGRYRKRTTTTLKNYLKLSIEHIYAKMCTDVRNQFIISHIHTHSYENILTSMQTCIQIHTYTILYMIVLCWKIMCMHFLFACICGLKTKFSLALYNIQNFIGLDLLKHSFIRLFNTISMEQQFNSITLLNQLIMSSTSQSVSQLN